MSLARRRWAFRRGHVAELKCLWHLRLHGWRMLARRFRALGRGRSHRPAGPRARRHRSEGARQPRAAAQSILPQQRRRVARALDRFLALRPELAQFDIRFDVMLVTPAGWPRHIADAWRDEHSSR